jgi:hypothetical protein
VAVNKTGEGPGLMVSIRSRSRKDGSEYFSVVYRFHGKQWLNRHIENLTGVDPNTKTKYQAHVRNDLRPAPGELPLTALSTHVVSIAGVVRCSPAGLGLGVAGVPR